ncbi:MAG TPA: hypothetical protein VM198_06155, partial [Longimicrobiales bacterium]|nr:hypothetical protein [Longimicrobiales bacterium]
MSGLLGLIRGSVLVGLLLGIGGGSQALAQDPPPRDWTYFGGSRAFTRYAPLDQIDGSSVRNLRVVWRRPALDASYVEAYPDQGEPPPNLRGVPILIDDVLYAPNGRGLVEAFHPGTGRTIWVQEMFAETPDE